MNVSQENNRRGWILTAVGLAIAYSASYINLILARVGVEWRLQGPASVILWNWLAVVLLIAFIGVVEGRGLRSINLRRPNRGDILWALLFWLISFVASIAFYSLVPPAPSGGGATLAALPLPVLVALVFTTAITEEILFRGYPIERLQELTGGVWLAVLVSFILFTIPHLGFFGYVWLLHHGVSLVLLYTLYVWRRNLWACMVMHLLGNAPILLMATGPKTNG